MSELFTDLYRYRQREKKNNLEDWLTECVAAILRALPKPVFAAFAARLTGQNADSIANVFEDLSIATQVTIDRGTQGSQRPDLLISIAAPDEGDRKKPSQPWLLFENKVFHHVDEEELDSGEIQNQLHRYGNWLRKQDFDRPEFSRALVFITHGTQAPDDFKTPDDNHPSYGKLGRICGTWGSLADLLEEVSSDFDDALHFRELIKAYHTFLKEHGMADDYPEYRDYSDLAAYIETGDKFEKLVNEMICKLDCFAPFRGRVSWAHSDADRGIFYAYRYLAEGTNYDQQTYVATGIWFPDRGEGWYSEELEEAMGSPISHSPKIFLQLANDKDGALGAIEGEVSDQFFRFETDFFAFREVASFPPDPAEAATEILMWVESEGAQLNALLVR